MIDTEAFVRCTGLGSVTFEDLSEIQDIGNSAFSAIPSLTKILLPAKLQTIGMDAFLNCGLRQVSFKDNSQLHTIGPRAFAGTALRRCGVLMVTVWLI
jgi:hypothetical protein